MDWCPLYEHKPRALGVLYNEVPIYGNSSRKYTVTAPLYLHGIGHVHPPNVISSQFLEDLDIGTSAQWIHDRLGIRERRTALSLAYIRETRNRDMRASLEALEFSNIDAGQVAARLALERARISAAQIDLVIAGSSCPVHSSPPESCIIADRLGIATAAFDLHSACTGFLTHISVAQAWLAANDKEFALLVQCEHMTRMVDYNDRVNASIMGDATVAAVVSTRVRAPLAFKCIHLGAEPSLWKSALVSPLRPFTQETSAVRQFAESRLAAGIVPGDHQYVIFHQANLRLLEATFKRLNLSNCTHLYNVDRFGNCASAGCPSVISEYWEDLSAMRGATALSIVGGGLTFGSAILSRSS